MLPSFSRGMKSSPISRLDWTMAHSFCRRPLTSILCRLYTADYINTVEKSVFVLDYDHNAPTVKYLEQTHEPFFKRIRAVSPDLPVVQQNSNTTYRVSDYGRLGADGKPRPLHIEKALDVTKRERPQIPYGNAGKTEKTPYGTVRELAKCSFFIVSLLELDGKTEIHCEDSFTSLLVLKGKVTVKWKDGEIKVSKGASIFVPADCLTDLSGKAEILISKV